MRRVLGVKLSDPGAAGTRPNRREQWRVGGAARTSRAAPYACRYGTDDFDACPERGPDTAAEHGKQTPGGDD